MIQEASKFLLRKHGTKVFICDIKICNIMKFLKIHTLNKTNYRHNK